MGTTSYEPPPSPQALPHAEILATARDNATNGADELQYSSVHADSRALVNGTLAALLEATLLGGWSPTDDCDHIDDEGINHEYWTKWVAEGHLSYMRQCYREVVLGRMRNREQYAVLYGDSMKTDVPKTKTLQMQKAVYSLDKWGRVIRVVCGPNCVQLGGRAFPLASTHRSVMGDMMHVMGSIKDDQIGHIIAPTVGHTLLNQGNLDPINFVPMAARMNRANRDPFLGVWSKAEYFVRAQVKLGCSVTIIAKFRYWTLNPELPLVQPDHADAYRPWRMAYLVKSEEPLDGEDERGCTRWFVPLACKNLVMFNCWVSNS